MEQVKDILNLMPVGMRTPEAIEKQADLPEAIVEEYIDMVQNLAKPPKDITGVTMGSLEILTQLASNMIAEAQAIVELCGELSRVNQLGFTMPEDAEEGLAKLYAELLVDDPSTTITEAYIQCLLHSLHMKLGSAGEAGELLDALKKNLIYGKELDTANVVEELGDSLFYAVGNMCYKTYGKYANPADIEEYLTKASPNTHGLMTLAVCLGVEWEDLLVANMDKLLKGKNARYAAGKYSDKQAIERADKGEE